MNGQEFQARGLSFEDAETYTCSVCGHDRFEVAYLIKRFSALISPSGQEMLTPIQAFACKECGNINDDFLPEKQTL